MNHEAIATALRKLRGDLPRETVAKAIGVSTSALSMYENGQRVPRDAVKIRIAEFYGKSVASIFFNG